MGGGHGKSSRITVALASCLMGLFAGCLLLRYQQTAMFGENGADREQFGMAHDRMLPQNEDEWRSRLTAEQFRVLRKKGTERAFTGEHWNNKDEGTYHCAGCGEALFHSAAKYDSGTGWPSFFAPVTEENVATESDNSFFMRRTEVLCRRCHGHLGHVFPDGPAPTGTRYCINSAALEFQPADDMPPDEP